MSHGDHPALPDHLESLLTDDAHTVFLKADCPPRVKRGTIGSLKLVEVESSTADWDTLALEQLEEDLVALVEEHRHRSDCFLEIDRKGCRVIQLGDLRITSAWPPFSDAREITVVRPVAKLSLGDYDLDQRLIDRLRNHHRGVFICGRPGSGKTTVTERAVAMANAAAGPARPFVVLPMDGFHIRRELLVDERMRRRRGAHFTFDAAALLAKVRELGRLGAAGGPGRVGWPSFDHAVDDPREDHLEVRAGTHRVVVIEGLYMLLRSGPWSREDADARPADAAHFESWDALRGEGLLDARWFVSCDADAAMARVVRRHMAANGNSEGEARARVEGNDSLNAELILRSVADDALVDRVFANNDDTALL